MAHDLAHAFRVGERALYIAEGKTRVQRRPKLILKKNVKPKVETAT